MTEPAPADRFATYNAETLASDHTHRARLDRIAEIEARTPEGEPRWLGPVLFVGAIVAIGVAVTWAMR